MVIQAGYRDEMEQFLNTNTGLKIWVWDYAAEDGDYVQILVNGLPMTDSFMIRHKPKAFTVPSTGEVQIKGRRGIAVRSSLPGNLPVFFVEAAERIMLF